MPSQLHEALLLLFHNRPLLAPELLVEALHIERGDGSRDPELAVLSAMAHGGDADPDRSLRIALAAIAASVGLDPDRSTLYFDLVMTSLSAAAKEALESMDPAKYEYQSEFARCYIAKGKVEGESEGLAKG